MVRVVPVMSLKISCSRCYDAMKLVVVGLKTSGSRLHSTGKGPE